MVLNAKYMSHVCFNTLQVTLFPACSKGYDNHLTVLEHLNITCRHIDTIPYLVTLFWQHSNQLSSFPIPHVVCQSVYSVKHII